MAQKKIAKIIDSRANTLMLAFLCVKDATGFAEQVAILDRFDLPDAEIALVCGKAEKTVRNTRLENKNKSKRSKDTEAKPPTPEAAV